MFTLMFDVTTKDLECNVLKRMKQIMDPGTPPFNWSGRAQIKNLQSRGVGIQKNLGENVGSF